MTGNNTLSYRVSQLEKNYEKLDGKIETLLVNDIPHLQQSLSSLKVRMDILTVVNVSAIVLGIIVSKFL